MSRFLKLVQVDRGEMSVTSRRPSISSTSKFVHAERDEMSVTLQPDINSFLNFEHALRDEMSWMFRHLLIFNSSRLVNAETAEMSDTTMSDLSLNWSDMFSLTRAVHAAMGDMSFPTTHTDRSTNLGSVGRSEMSVTSLQPIICRVSKLVHAVRDEMSLIFTHFEISKWRRLVSVEIDEMSLNL